MRDTPDPDPSEGPPPGRSSSSIDLAAPVESLSHTGRVTSLRGPAEATHHDLELGHVHARIAWMDGVRFERSAAFAERVPRRTVLLHLVSGSMAGEFAGRPFRMVAGDTLAHVTTRPGWYECSEGTVLLGLAVDAEAGLPGGGASTGDVLPRTGLLEATVAFVEAVLTGDGPVHPGEPALAGVLLALMRNVLVEACSTIPDDRLPHCVEQHVADHLADRGLDAASIAEAFGMTPRRLQDVLPRPAAHIREQRLQAVAAILGREPAAPGAAALAAQVGYRDGEALTRAFRRRFGCGLAAFHRERWP